MAQIIEYLSGKLDVSLCEAPSGTPDPSPPPSSSACFSEERAAIHRSAAAAAAGSQAHERTDERTEGQVPSSCETKPGFDPRAWEHRSFPLATSNPRSVQSLLFALRVVFSLGSLSLDGRDVLKWLLLEACSRPTALPLIKIHSNKTEKMYVCLFVCMSPFHI